LLDEQVVLKVALFTENALIEDDACRRTVGVHHVRFLIVNTVDAVAGDDPLRGDLQVLEVDSLLLETQLHLQ